MASTITNNLGASSSAAWQTVHHRGTKRPPRNTKSSRRQPNPTTADRPTQRASRQRPPGTPHWSQPEWPLDPIETWFEAQEGCGPPPGLPAHGYGVVFDLEAPDTSNPDNLSAREVRQRLVRYFREDLKLEENDVASPWPKPGDSRLTFSLKKEDAHLAVVHRLVEKQRVYPDGQAEGEDPTPRLCVAVSRDTTPLPLGTEKMIIFDPHPTLRSQCCAQSVLVQRMSRC